MLHRSESISKTPNLLCCCWLFADVHFLFIETARVFLQVELMGSDIEKRMGNSSSNKLRLLFFTSGGLVKGTAEHGSNLEVNRSHSLRLPFQCRVTHLTALAISVRLSDIDSFFFSF